MQTLTQQSSTQSIDADSKRHQSYVTGATQATKRQIRRRIKQIKVNFGNHQSSVLGPRGQMTQQEMANPEQTSSDQLDLLKLIQDNGYMGSTSLPAESIDQTKNTISTAENRYQNTLLNPTQSSQLISRLQSKNNSPSAANRSLSPISSRRDKQQELIDDVSSIISSCNFLCGSQ